MLDFSEVKKLHRTLVTRLTNDKPVPNGIHYTGLPPALTAGIDSRISLPPTSWLFIRQYPHSNSDAAELYRFGADGSSAGDSWHATYDDALEQALHEFGIALEAWYIIPNEKWGDLNYAASLICGGGTQA